MEHKGKKKRNKKEKIQIDYCTGRQINGKALTAIKWLGLVFAAGDNIVYGFSDVLDNSVMSALSIAGCLAYPLLAFYLTEYFHYLKSNGENQEIKSALKKLALVAVLCEFPFNFIKNNSVFYLNNQNLFMTLTAGFLLLMAMNYDYDKIVAKLSPKEEKRDKTRQALKSDILAALVIFTAFANFDYGGEGLIFIALLDLARKKKHLRIWQGFAFFSIILLRFNFMYWVMLADYIIILIAEHKIERKSGDPKNSTMPACAELTIISQLFYFIQLAVIFIIQLFLTVNAYTA